MQSNRKLDNLKQKREELPGEEQKEKVNRKIVARTSSPQQIWSNVFS